MAEMSVVRCPLSIAVFLPRPVLRERAGVRASSANQFAPPPPARARQRTTDHGLLTLHNQIIHPVHKLLEILIPPRMPRQPHHHIMPPPARHHRRIMPPIL